MQRHARLRVEIAREVGELLGHHLGNSRIEFHGIDMGSAVPERTQHLGAAAGPEYQHARRIEQGVGQLLGGIT